MKFGKSIVASQVAGWSDYYLNYKALKKIINSLAAGRPASEASLLAVGGRPDKRVTADALTDSELDTPVFKAAESASNAPVAAAEIAPPAAPALGATDIDLADLEPLPPTSEPPGGRLGSSGQTNSSTDRAESLKAHRDVFFFVLQRELEKINAFYLIKERELRLRLLTLLTNRKRLLRSQRELVADGADGESSSNKRPAEWASLEEGWNLFERDLGKLQGFIEINATGFRKILKKWDKRSKSNTKELYLERQVEVQPCFNREFIAKLSDIVAANLLDIENGSLANLSSEFFAGDLPEPIGDDYLAFDREDYESDPGEALTTDALLELEANLPKALEGGRDALAQWLRHARKLLLRDKSDKRAMRILWRAALAVPDDYLDLVIAQPIDFYYTDKINDRTALHQACIVGSLRLVELCLASAPDLLEREDAYARRPLHYAAKHGHPSIVQLLLSSHAEVNRTDMDGYTPLMLGVVQGHLEVVRIFVANGCNLGPSSASQDLIPLSLACQFGHLDVARLLLERGAKSLANSEGLYPMHFAAKAGHEAICRLLVEKAPNGGGIDKQDKYNLWTPLHYAAMGNDDEHLECIKVLVSAGADVNTPDDYGKSAGWYAAWHGHVRILNFLIDAGARLSNKEELTGMENLGLAADPQMDSLSPGSDIELDPPAADEFELIPSLSLPPPIMPLRVYGHEFLAKRCLVQLSLGHAFSHEQVPPVKLYSRYGSDQDSLHMWSSLKLVLTSKSDTSVVPHSVILPLADNREVFSFQAQSLDKFTLQISLYPTFGSKVIGRAVILPSTFIGIQDHKSFVAPLLDHHLKTIGEVAFELCCIKPFEGAQLEIGGRVETYWKSKVTPSNPIQDHAHQVHRPIGVSTASPAVKASNVVAPSQPEPALVTASSLSGDYLRLKVQVTKDGVPVSYPDYKLPIAGVDVGISDVTYAQFLAIAKQEGRDLPLEATAADAAEWRKIVAPAMASLERILVLVPPDIGINFCLKYTREFDAKVVGVGRSAELNDFVDNVLKVVYDAGKLQPGRKILFSSFDPTVCTALNWKQPNFAVFFSSYCGIDRFSVSDTEPSTVPHLVPHQDDVEPDNRCLSVREAVNFAKVTNLLGVILEASTLAAVPSLVASVKDAGLLLATFGNEQDLAKLRQGASDGRTVDAFCDHGIMSLVI